MNTDDDPITPAMNTLLGLFATELADQRFGELDRSTLESAAAVVRAAANELAEVEAMAEAARASPRSSPVARRSTGAVPCR